MVNEKSQKRNVGKAKTGKKPRSRTLMYSEAIGCLPERWLDKRYLHLCKSVELKKMNEKGEEENIKHKDGTNVIYYEGAILDMNAMYRDLEERFPKDTEFAIMVHDKEYKYDEAIKEHVHVSVYFRNAKTPSAMAKIMGLYDEGKAAFIEAYKGTYAKENAFNYLPHLTDEAKDEKEDYTDYLDKPSKFRANFKCKEYIRVVQEVMDSREYNLDVVIDDILNRDLIEYDFHSEEAPNALRKFYLKNKSKIDEALKMSNRDVIANARKKGEGNGLKILYVQGMPGSGKTKMAIEIAKRLYKSYYITGSSNDPLQDFMGQECLIFDDARPSDFDASDWLKMLDPYNGVASVKSRYFNKAIPVKCIILTTTVPFEEFFVYAKKKGSVEEPLNQFIRRFTAVIDVSKDVRSLIEDRIYGLKTHVSGDKSVCGRNNFRMHGENRAYRYVDVYEKYKHDYGHNGALDKAVEVFENESNIKELKAKYDSYTVGRMYSIKQVDEPIRVEVLTPDSIERYEIDRCLVEAEKFISIGLNKETTEKDVEELIEAFL